MTEELKQEARRLYIDWERRYCKESISDLLVMFAEPREKQIAELEKKLEQIKNEKFETALSQIKHDRQKVIEYNKRLQKENAELKADNDARKFAMAMSEKVEKQLRKENAELKEDNSEWEKASDKWKSVYELTNNQLTKAKELLKEFVHHYKAKTIYIGNMQDLLEKAEQFLNSEVVE